MNVKNNASLLDEDLLESGSNGVLCPLCEDEKIMLEDAACCLRCNMRWCKDCAIAWQKKCLEMQLDFTCPFCRSLEIKFSHRIEKDLQKDDNSAKGIVVLASYIFLFFCIVLYFFAINDVSSDNDFVYFVMYLLFLAYVFTCLFFASKSLFKCCNR